MRVRTTVTVGGHGMAGDGMTPELVRALRAAGFEGDPEGWAMVRVTDSELPLEAIAALAWSWPIPTAAGCRAVAAEMGIDPAVPMTGSQHAEFTRRMREYEWRPWL